MEADSLNNAQTHTHSRLQELVTFFLVFLGTLAFTYGVLFLVDFLPEKPTDKSTEVQEEVAPTTVGETLPEIVVIPVDPYPTKIIFDSLSNRAVTVLNPEEDTVPVLDAALLKGVVRHPDSGDFERVGTIVLFGHSSYLPNVINKNFQAFNGIQKLVWGDTIRLQSSDTEYTYQVDRVYEASATDAEVKIEAGKSRLTLVTCDSFGSKADRFVVETTLISEKKIDQSESAT